VFDTTITPQIARTLATFGGTSLAAVLGALGVKLPVQGKVRLYQALPGTSLSQIAALERGVPGLGSVGRAAWSQLHPLTPDAAGMLLGQPGLGRNVDPRYLQQRGLIGVGQRFYHLEIPGLRPRITTCTRPSEVNVTIDARPGRGEVRVAIYLDEAHAQDVAARLQRREITSVFPLLRAVAEAGVRSALGGNAASHVRILTETVSAESLLPASAGLALLRTIGAAVISWIVSKIADWVAAAISRFLQRQAEEFVGAARDPACGLTILIAIPDAPVLAAFRTAATGVPSSLPELAALARASAVVPVVRVRPGLSRG
jgi:hypothetical protein